MTVFLLACKYNYTSLVPTADIENTQTDIWNLLHLVANIFMTHTCYSKLCRVVSCVVLCCVGRIQFPSACHMNYDPYTVFSVEHYTSLVTPEIKYVIVVIIIIICKPRCIKVDDFPAHNKQQFMH